MLVLGVDSAATTGYALLERTQAGVERVVSHGAARVRGWADVDHLVAGWTVQEPDLVAIEEPFVHPRYPMIGLVLAQLCGRWRQEFERRGFTVVTIPASMWQTTMLPGVTPTTKSAFRKAAAVAWVRECFGVVVGEDEADAIVLATWTARNARVGKAA